MRVKKRCRYCSDLFTPDPRSYRPRSDGKGRRSSQEACPKAECRRHRRSDANRQWRVKNPTYDDQRQAQHCQWRANHPGYPKAYRAAHPEYVQRNREQQRRRDRKGKNLVNQDAIHAFYDGKIRRLIDLVNQDAIRTPATRVSEEIRRYLSRSFRLGKQDVIALQKKITQNRGHEPTP
jgi:hypothetical protein